MNTKKQKSSGIQVRSSLQTGGCYDKCYREFNVRDVDVNQAWDLTDNITEFRLCLNTCQ